MFGDLKPSHLLLIFLSGALATVLLIPPLVFIIYPVSISNIGDIYKNATKFASEAGFLGSVIGIALVYFVGLVLDGLNVITRKRGQISRIKSLIGRLWGYGKIIDYIQTQRGIRSQTEPGKPTEYNAVYSQQIIWYAQNPAYATVRGWEFFLSFSFSLLTLTLSILFILLFIVTVLIWIKYNVPLSSSIPWIMFSVILYTILIPGEVSHTYSRINVEEKLKQEYEKSRSEDKK